jgi:hypothetical protein
MRVTDRLDVFCHQLKRGTFLFTLFFPVLWIGWVFYAFRMEERSIVIRYGMGRLFFEMLQGVEKFANWIVSFSNQIRPETNFDNVFLIKNILEFLRNYFKYIDERVLLASLWVLIASIVLSIFGVWLLNAAFGPVKPKNDERLLRGAKELSWQQLVHRTGIPLWKWWLADERRNQIYIGQVPIPFYVETRHILLVGSTGTGKSQSVYQIAKKIIERNDRAFVLDLNGALLSRFAMNGDQILNPLDRRSVKWNPFLDIQDSGDLESLVQATIPSAQGESEEWRGYARTIMQAVLIKLKGTENAQPSRVVYYSTHAGTKELAQLCEGTAAQRFFEKGNEKLLSNSLTNFSQGVASWSELDDGGTFSMRKWIREGEGSLYINVRDKQFDLLRPLVSSWIWLAITETLSLPEDDTRRLWFLLDELASYNQLPKLAEALAKLRKYGGCVVAALQDVAQLDSIYGHDQARTLRNCFSTYVALRCEDPDTAEYAARRVGGKQEVEREHMSTTSAPQSRSQTRSRDTGAREAILDSEIKNLPDRVAYLKISGDNPVAKINIPVSAVAVRVTAFVPRQELQESAA